MIIGVSGKSGSGKSSVSRYIAKRLDYTLLDLDLISKEIRQEYKNKILRIVKKDILKGEEIDSKKLGAILFENKRLMARYNAFMYKKLKEKIKQYKGDIIIDSIFLPVMSIFKKLDIKILVVCDDSNRMTRVIKRDNVTKEYFLARDGKGLNYNHKDFDFIINNDGDFKDDVDKLLRKIA